ncbi:MAG: UDP-N-acetylmuramoyl-tripeptide--D-alanyl-D-alanine ligase [Nitrospinaceae bacterium]
MKATGGALLKSGAADQYAAVSINSRTLAPGQVFWCIRGERFDGHDFLAEAVRKGAAGLVISKPEKLPGLSAAGQAPFVVVVADTLRGLQDLAHFHRTSMRVKVLAVTGTNGKSTTKEMAAAISDKRFRTFKSQGNFNNHIGLPLNLLDLKSGHEVAVLEMGMSAKGEIRRLCEIAEPDLGLITNISEAHMESLKTLQDIQAAKGEMFTALKREGTAIVNADDPLILELTRSLRASKVTFGMDNPADVRARDVRLGESQGYQFTLDLLGRAVRVHLPFPGRCNVYNALAAAAAGLALGLEPEDIQRGLEGVRLLGQRAEMLRHGGIVLLNDTYNANPRSMQEALQTLGEFRTTGRRFFVIGDMLELGDREESAHRSLGDAAARAGIDFLVAVGPRVRGSVQAALEAGMAKDRAVICGAHEDAADFLKKSAKTGDCILFKGSRGARMERVLEIFTQTP